MKLAPTGPEIIAEIGVNHDGDVSKALHMIDAVAEAGAHVAKFQTFVAGEVVTAEAPMATYQQENIGKNASQYDMLKALELPEAAYPKLVQRCAARGVDFMSTPTSRRTTALLTQTLGLRRIKISSADLTNHPFLWHAAQSSDQLILSTGMADLADISEALAVVACAQKSTALQPNLDTIRAAIGASWVGELLRDTVVLLHCTSQYPAPFGELNLRAMETIKSEFGLAVGYSDHSSGTEIPIAATALGAVIIEKHVTDDKSLPGPDHSASIDFAELSDMCAAVAHVAAAMGDGAKRPQPSEANTASVARKSLVAARPIAQGQILEAEDFAVKRPADGLHPAWQFGLMGQPADRSYAVDEKIDMGRAPIESPLQGGDG